MRPSQPTQQLQKSYRPQSSKNGKQVMHVQTLQFEVVEQPQPQQQKNNTQNKVKKVKVLSTTGTIKTNPRSGSPDNNQFDQFMLQKMQNNSDVKRLYEDDSTQKIQRKPFQIQKQLPQEEDNKSAVSAQTEFTLISQNSKKPYGNFYKNYKSYDTNAPTKKQISALNDNDLKKLTITNPSFVSTDKSYDLTMEENDTNSVHSSQMNLSQNSKKQTPTKVEQQNFKQFVQMKKQKNEQIEEPTTRVSEVQSVNFGGWVVNPPLHLQTRQYQSVMENYENIIENSTQKRAQYLKKLDGYIEMVKGGQQEKKEKVKDGQQEKKEKKPQKKHSNQEQEDTEALEKEIRKLAKVLRRQEKENTENQYTVRSLHSIAEEPIENLSNLTAQGLRDRSMFITELMKNRSRIQNQLSKVNEDVDYQSQLNSSQMSDTLSELDARASKHQKKQTVTQESKDDLPPEYQKRLKSLLDTEQLDQNPYDMLKTMERKEKWNTIHTKLKQYNKNHQEFETLELHDDLLPKDKFLRQEALDRIIRIRNQEVNQGLHEIATKSQVEGGLEDKYKIKDLVQKLQSSGMSRSEILIKYPEMQEEIKLRAQRFLDLQEQEQQVLDILSKFNPEEALSELTQLKQELEDAVKMSKDLQSEIEQDPRYQLAITIKEKKDILLGLEVECQELNARSEKLFAFEAFVVNMQEEDVEPSVTENTTQIQVVKSIDEYDYEMTEKLKALQPELFEFVSEFNVK